MRVQLTLHCTHLPHTVHYRHRSLLMWIQGVLRGVKWVFIAILERNTHGYDCLSISSEPVFDQVKISYIGQKLKGFAHPPKPLIR